LGENKFVIAIWAGVSSNDALSSPARTKQVWCDNNLVPQACDPQEGTRGSGIIRFREESDWPLKWNA
jgi:hypothetical protein